MKFFLIILTFLLFTSKVFAETSLHPDWKSCIDRFKDCSEDQYRCNTFEKWKKQFKDVKYAGPVPVESYDDAKICMRATDISGNNFLTPDTVFGTDCMYEYVYEARKRNLTLNDCNKLTGKGQNNTSVNTSLDGGTEHLKTRLKDLRELLDEGLISQEQYDEKSSKILDEF